MYLVLRYIFFARIEPVKVNRSILLSFNKTLWSWTNVRNILHIFSKQYYDIVSITNITCRVWEPLLHIIMTTSPHMWCIYRHHAFVRLSMHRRCRFYVRALSISEDMRLSMAFHKSAIHNTSQWGCVWRIF